MKTFFLLNQPFYIFVLQVYVTFVKPKNRLHRHQIVSTLSPCLHSDILIPRLNRCCRSLPNRRRRCWCSPPWNSGARCCARSCTPWDSCESSSTIASSSDCRRSKMSTNFQNLVCNFKDLLADFLVAQNVNIVKDAATVLKIVGTERVTE